MSSSNSAKTAAQSIDRKEAIKRIDNFIAEHDDWRGETMAQIRKIIHEVAPEVVEDWKYMGSPFWSHEGILGHGNIFKAKVAVAGTGQSLPSGSRVGAGGNRSKP